MAYDGWIEYNGVEVVNLSRTVQLAEALNINTIWLRAASLAWIETELGGSDYDDITQAPWYDAGVPASSEFAGVIPLEITALDDSTTEATPTEYITAGGHPGRPRNATKAMVWNATLVASTVRGAEYGKRWLDRVLHETGSGVFCYGSDLRYFRYPTAGSPVAHHRNVRLTRGISVTRKRMNSCSATWMVTFTMTAGDPHEYGEPIDQFVGMASEAWEEFTGDGIDYDAGYGATVLIESTCPVYDYTPIYDPLYPALVAPPTPPEFYPDGWLIVPGMTFERFYTHLLPVEPTDFPLVPVITLTSGEEARMIRVGIWDAAVSEPGDQCDPLWMAVVTYLPPDVDFIIDGEQEAAYVFDGGTSVRRADSLVYSNDASPVQWAAFNRDNLLVTLDVFSESDGPLAGDFVEMALSLVPKSD